MLIPGLSGQVLGNPRRLLARDSTLNPFGMSWRELTEIAERGVVTSNGVKITSALALPLHPTEGGDVSIFNEWIKNLNDHRAYKEGIDYIKTRTQDSNRRAYSQGKTETSDTLSLGWAESDDPTEQYRSSDGQFSVLTPDADQNRQASIDRWEELFVKRGMISGSTGFGLKHVKTLLHNLREDEFNVATEQSATMALQRVCEVFSTANAIECSPDYEPVNLVRLATRAKEYQDLGNPGRLYSTNHHIRFQVPENARPTYDDLDLKTREGDSLYYQKEITDHRTGEKKLISQFRKIRTGCPYMARAEEIEKMMEYLYNGMEGPFGDGHSFLISVHPPETGDPRVNSNPQWGDLLTTEEATFNELAKFYNYSERFPWRKIGEIKKAETEIFFPEFHNLPFRVKIYQFDFQSDEASKPYWGEVVPVDEEDLPLHLDTDEKRALFLHEFRKMRPTREDDTRVDSLFRENPLLEARRYIRDRNSAEFIEKPQFMNEYGEGNCAVYSIITFRSWEDFMYLTLPEFHRRLVNWHIKCNTDRTKDEGPRIKANKLDLKDIYFPAHLFGYDARTPGPSFNARMIYQIDFTDNDVKSGKKQPPRRIVTPFRFVYDPEMRDLMPIFCDNADKDGDMVHTMGDDGYWRMTYHSPMEEYFIQRRELAALAYEGIKDEENGVWHFACPISFDADRRLFHLVEFIERFKHLANEKKRIRDNQWMWIDQEYDQGWYKPAYHPSRKITGIETDCFEIAKTYVCIPYLHVALRAAKQKARREFLNERARLRKLGVDVSNMKFVFNPVATGSDEANMPTREVELPRGVPVREPVAAIRVADREAVSYLVELLRGSGVGSLRELHARIYGVAQDSPNADDLRTFGRALLAGVNAELRLGGGSVELMQVRDLIARLLINL